MLPHHQVLICGIYVLPQLCHFWDLLQGELADERLYIASIESMRLSLSELQSRDLEAQKFRGSEFAAEGWEDIKRVFHHQGLTYVPQIICLELISHHHDDSLADISELTKHGSGLPGSSIDQPSAAMSKPI